MTIAGESGFLMENDASCLPCTPEEEKEIIKDLMDTAADANGSSSMKEGDLYYVLSNRWFMQWQRYTRQELVHFSILDSNSSNGVLSSPTPRPSQIDNHHLVIEGSNCNQGDDFDLIRTLQEEVDYVLVSEPVWKKLHDWYKGGPALPRKAIAVGVAHRTFTVEVFPLRLQLIDARDRKQYVIRISKKASLRELYHQVNMLLGIEEEKVCIWDYFDERKCKKLAVADQTLEEALLQMDQHILLEIEPSGSLASAFGMDSTGNGLALVPVEPSRSSFTIAGGPSLSNGNSTGYIYNFYEGNSLVSPFTDVEDESSLSKMTKIDRGGLAGLQNLGNTCFMNSALQCLVHTPPLLEYFLQDYSDEINKQNPIGMQGELAIAFGELLRKLWSSGRAPIAPRAFKAKLVRFAPQFSGYNQHDSQELLAFLLDGLHEDLNRVKFKPYIELKDANGRADEEVANECWEIHKARNDSVIVDVCQGQYKSTLVCPVCSKVSVTFDPFMYLSLPLPSRVTRSMTITVFYGDGSGLPMPFTVTVLKHGYYKDLFQALATACCLRHDETLLLAEVYEHVIFRYLENPVDPLSSIKDEDQIVAYRLPKNHEEGFTRLEIIQRSEDNKCSGTPLVTCLAEGARNSKDIQNAVQMVLSPLLKIKQDEDKMEVEEQLCYDLWVSEDEKGMNSGSRIGSDFVYEAEGGITMKVLLDWREREYEMYDISYLEDLPVVHKSGFTAKKTRQEAISLFSCLEAFLKEEPLGPDDMWYCPSCKAHRQATKKLDLWRLPEVLVVHLKRFSYSRYLKNKLDTFVNYPIRNLDLSKYVKSGQSSHLYELYAISNHYGGLGGGHYSAYAKVSEWYNFDDSHVSGISEEDVKTAAAYVLFYRRVSSSSSG